MRKLVVGLTAALLVGLPATAAYAPPTQKCPSPETLKFEAPFQVGQSQGGITITAAGSNTVTFSIGNQVVVTDICVKAGTTAAVFTTFPGTSTTVSGITITYSCTFPGANTGDTLVGPCTVTVQGGGPGLGLSHVTFYTTAYVAPQVAGAEVEAAGVAAGGAAGGTSGSTGGLAFTGAQITLLLVLLASLIGAGILAWTAGRRRAAKSD
jgi:hypothetical protein